MEIIMAEPNACISTRCPHVADDDDTHCRQVSCCYKVHKQRLLAAVKDRDRMAKAREVGGIA
jgi:hypothetical protein